MRRRPYRTGILAVGLTALTGLATGTGIALASPSPTGAEQSSARASRAAPGTANCHALVRTDPGGKPAAATPSGYFPADLQSAYKLPSGTAGGGRTVAVVDAFDDPTAEADLGVYRSTFGLSPCTTA